MLSELKPLNFENQLPRVGSHGDEILEGLRASPKRLSPKFLYDKRGSDLFEQICSVKEYYPTRTEIGILRTHEKEILEAIGSGCTLVEFGSGASLKTRILLDGLQSPGGYIPIDISKEFLVETSKGLSHDYPSLPIHSICADYTRPLKIDFESLGFSNPVVFFPGSTIGNFDPGDALQFLNHAANLVGSGGKLLIGVDTVKHPALLEAAYDDSAGVTAQFNLNLLHRMNREFDADFDVSKFRHRAFFNRELKRVEMHLVSLERQDIDVMDEKFHFEPLETIHTECSYKYEPDTFLKLAARAGFELNRFWSDPERMFAVYLLQVKTSFEQMAA